MVAGVGVAGVVVGEAVVGDAVEGDSVAADSVGGVVAVPSVVGAEVGGTGLEVVGGEVVDVDVVDVDVVDADVLGGVIGAACPAELGPQPLNATAAMASPATALSRVLTVSPCLSRGCSTPARWKDRSSPRTSCPEARLSGPTNCDPAVV